MYKFISISELSLVNLKFFRTMNKKKKKKNTKNSYACLTLFSALNLKVIDRKPV